MLLRLWRRVNAFLGARVRVSETLHSSTPASQVLWKLRVECHSVRVNCVRTSVSSHDHRKVLLPQLEAQDESSGCAIGRIPIGAASTSCGALRPRHPRRRMLGVRHGAALWRPSWPSCSGWMVQELARPSSCWVCARNDSEDEPRQGAKEDGEGHAVAADGSSMCAPTRESFAGPYFGRLHGQRQHSRFGRVVAAANVVQMPRCG